MENYQMSLTLCLRYPSLDIPYSYITDFENTLFINRENYFVNHMYVYMYVSYRVCVFVYLNRKLR